MKNVILADIIHLFHSLLLIVLLTGGILLPKRFLSAFIIVGLLVLLDWNDIDGMCILTKLEYYFRTGEWVSSPASQEGAPEFFRPFMKRYLGLNLTRPEADRLNTWIVVMMMLIAFLRYK